LHFAGTQATGASDNSFGGTVYHSAYPLQIGLPFPFISDMRVANFHAGNRSFAANFTSSHKHTSFWLYQIDRHYAILTESKSFGKFFLKIPQKNFSRKISIFSPQADDCPLYHKMEL